MVSDVVIVGAGIVGAACTWECAHAGMGTTYIDRGPVSGGATTEFLFGLGHDVGASAVVSGASGESGEIVGVCRLRNASEITSPFLNRIATRSVSEGLHGILVAWSLADASGYYW